MLIAKALERYLRYHRAEGSTAQTLRWHNKAIGQLAAFLPSIGHGGDVEDLGADDLRQWIAALQARGLAQASVATYVRSVKAFGRWLAAEDYVNRDPFARVRVPKVDDIAKPTLTPGEVDRLLATCDRTTVTGARDYAVMLLMYSTGLRAGEVLGLRVGDVDSDGGLIRVQRGKGGKFRVVPLGRVVDKAIGRYLRHPGRPDDAGDDAPLFQSQVGGRWSTGGLHCMMQRRGAAAGVHCNPHKWRHSSAVQYLRNGGRVEVLQKMLGHSTLDMTLHYARVAGVDVIAAHDSADPLRSLKRR